MNTPTPETDALMQSSYGIKEINMLIFHARKLERERDEARNLVKAVEQGYDKLSKELIAERDQLRKDLEFLKSKECEAAWCERWKRLCEENTQLRKVCDELSLHLKNHQDFCSGPVDSFDSSGAALHHYNSLPHVIAAKKGKQ